MACESVRSVYVLPWFRVLSLIEDNMPLTRIQFSVDSKLFVIGQVSSSNVQINVAEFGSVTNAIMSPIRESETKPKIVEFAVTTATTEAKTSYNYKFFPVHNKFSPFCEVKLMKFDQRWVLFDVQRTLANCPSTSSVLVVIAHCNWNTCHTCLSHNDIILDCSVHWPTSLHFLHYWSEWCIWPTRW